MIIEVKKLIAENKVDEAFGKLEESNIGKSDGFILLRRKWKRLELDSTKGIIKREESAREESSILSSLLDLINQSGGSRDKHREFSESALSLDIKTYTKFLELLPPEGSIRELRNMIVAVRFKFEWFQEFYDIIDYRKEHPEFEFLDRDIEQQKNDLIDVIDEFVGELGQYTCPEVRGFSRIPPEWNHTQKEKYNKAVDTLYKLKKEIITNYDKFIKYSRKKLYVRD